MSAEESRPLIRKHIKLEDVLQLATPEELGEIVDILLDKSNDRILGSDAARQKIAASRSEGDLYNVIADIACEIRALGSNPIASMARRGQPVSYDKIVRDVAGELKVDFKKEDKPADIEFKLLEVLSTRLANQAEQPIPQAENNAEHEASTPESESSIRDSMLRVLRKFGTGVGTGAIGGIFAQSSVLGAGTVGGMLAQGSLGVAAVGVGAPLAVIPVTALAAYGAYLMATRNKTRPELQSLTMIVVQVARIRSGIVAGDHAIFVDKLRACL